MKARNLRNIVYMIDRKAKGLSLFLLFMGGLVYKESKASVKLGFFKRLRSNLKGFTSESIILYKNNPVKYDLGLYLSDYQRYNKAPRLNERHGIILADKNLFTDFMHKHRQFLPHVFALVKKGKIVAEDTNLYTIDSIKAIEKVIKETTAIVFKPIAGYAGHGILVCKWLDDELWLNNTKSSFADLDQEIKKFDNYIVSEYVFQADYASIIFSRTANTIRAFTIYDDETQTASVVAAIHRFGTNKSYPVDNFTRGSLSTAIDLESGVLGMSASHSTGGKVLWTETHPDSKAVINGVKIPNWNFIKVQLIMLAKYSHYTPVIGWDIISTNDGMKIIEANDSPGVDLIQIHKPLLINPTLADFYTKKRILKKRQIKAIATWRKK